MPFKRLLHTVPKRRRHAIPLREGRRRSTRVGQEAEEVTGKCSQESVVSSGRSGRVRVSR